MTSRNVLVPATLLLVSAFALSASAAPAAKAPASKKPAPTAGATGNGYGPGDGTGPFNPGDGTGYGAKKSVGDGSCIPLGDQIRRMFGKK
jgi:hypothetical protein